MRFAQGSKHARTAQGREAACQLDSGRNSKMRPRREAVSRSPAFSAARTSSSFVASSTRRYGDHPVSSSSNSTSTSAAYLPSWISFVVLVFRAITFVSEGTANEITLGAQGSKHARTAQGRGASPLPLEPSRKTSGCVAPKEIPPTPLWKRGEFAGVITGRRDRELPEACLSSRGFRRAMRSKSSAFAKTLWRDKPAFLPLFQRGPGGFPEGMPREPDISQDFLEGSSGRGAGGEG